MKGRSQRGPAPGRLRGWRAFPGPRPIRLLSPRHPPASESSSSEGLGSSLSPLQGGRRMVESREMESGLRRAGGLLLPLPRWAAGPVGRGPTGSSPVCRQTSEHRASQKSRASGRAAAGTSVPLSTCLSSGCHTAHPSQTPIPPAGPPGCVRVLPRWTKLRPSTPRPGRPTSMASAWAVPPAASLGSLSQSTLQPCGCSVAPAALETKPKLPSQAVQARPASQLRAAVCTTQPSTLSCSDVPWPPVLAGWWVCRELGPSRPALSAGGSGARDWA